MAQTNLSNSTVALANGNLTFGAAGETLQGGSGNLFGRSKHEAANDESNSWRSAA